MKNELTKQQSDDILQALDKAIETGPWAESNFLRVIGKNLKEIRDNFATQIGSKQNAAQSARDIAVANQTLKRASQQEVFIALYSSEGNNLQSWERILSNLPRQIISRPIYALEDKVKYLIKSKENKINEAYVSVFVSEDDILKVHEDKISFDKFGTPLMSLKDKKLNLDNITRFVHMSGTYDFVRGRLVIKHS
ncbi:MAG: Dot/Icm secretion system protein IcmQ [Tatlockia sp.]|nr:Dot/Icm secretion system protein IcmQ [Tatlockia sp.]